MKTYDNLYSQICSFENLYLAYCKAARGKRGQPNVATFEFNLEWKTCAQTAPETGAGSSGKQFCIGN